MIPVTRWFIKAGLISLGIGLLVLVIDATPHLRTGINLLPVYWHLIAIGWITQVIMGVSIWMFPRSREQRKQLLEKGNERGPLRPWVIFWSLNAGLVLRLLVEPLLSPSQPPGFAEWVTVLSAGLQLLAAVLYVFEIWPRIRGKQKAGGRKAATSRENDRRKKELPRAGRESGKQGEGERPGFREV